MISQYLKSKRASTLATTIIVISVISILGVAILSLAVMNYKARVFDKQQKANFYLAESGTEETYAKLIDIMNAAIDLGNQCIQDFSSNSFSDTYREYFDAEQFELYKFGFAAFLEGEKSKVLRGEISSYIDENLAVKDQAVQELFDSMFKAVYKGYANENIPGALDISTYKSIPDLNRFELVSNLKPFVLSEAEGSDTYDIDITSITYNQDKDTEDLSKYKSKEINIKLQLKVPSYGDNYSSVRKAASINENPLWSKALAADKAIIVRGNAADVSVNGDVYAYGVKPEGYEAGKNPLNYSGIILDSEGTVSDKSRLVINGNAVTDSYIMPTSSNSLINIKGSVFCNSLAIPETVSSAVIEVTGNEGVYAADDIELNGTRSAINIEGSFYGFEDGETGHDKSSSIVINSSDIDLAEGSKLKISGEVFLAGTVYINTDSPVPEEKGYQTGDSVAIRKSGNIDNPDLSNYMSYSEDYALRDEEGKMEEEDKKFLKESIEFLNYPPLYLAYNFLQLADQQGESFFKARTRSRYAYLFYKYKDEASITNPDFKLNLDQSDNIDIDYSKVIYSLGNIVSKGTMYQQRLISDPLYDNYRYNYKNRYNFYVNKLATVYKHAPNAGYDDVKLGIEDYVSFANFDNLDQTVQKYKELVFVHDDGKPLLIRGRMGDIPAALTGEAGTDYYIKDLGIDNELKGIVVTKGDVYVTGEVNYYGTLITTGNIYILDGNKKTFNNSYSVQQYLWNKIYNTNISATETLYSLFKNSSLYPDMTGEVTVSSTADTISTYKKYDDILTIVEWKKVK